MDKEELIKKSLPLLKGWTPGCYGLKYPAVVVSADAVIWRYNHNKGATPEILIGTRGEGRWQAGLPMVTIGGLINPDDLSAKHAVIREIEEEVGGLKIVVSRTPLTITGPLKFEHYWDPEQRCAVNTGKLVQDIPVITLNFLAECLSGDPQPTKEVPEIKWRLITELIKEEITYAFDMALILEEVFRHFSLIPFC